MVRAKAAIKGHPIHPMLVPVPIGLLTGALLADGAALVSRDRRKWLSRSAWCSNMGVITGLVAAAPGLIDFFGVARKTSAAPLGIAHMLANVSSLICFAIGGKNLDKASKGVGGCTLRGYALHGLGFALVMIGGVLGGEMSYRHRIGVVESEQNALPTAELPTAASPAPETLSTQAGEEAGTQDIPARKKTADQQDWDVAL